MRVVMEPIGRKSVTTCGDNIPIGTVFSGKIGVYGSKFFLMTYDSIVDLENPRNTWCNPLPHVYNFVELEAELTVRDKE